MHNEERASEQALVKAMLWQLNDSQASRWHDCRSSHRIMAFGGKELICYRLDSSNKPTDLVVLKCAGISASSLRGLESQWITETGRVVDLSHVPTEILPQVFMWHTYHSDLQYTPYKGVFNLRFSLLFKSRHHPNVKEAGHYYVQERATFNAEFGT